MARGFSPLCTHIDPPLERRAHAPRPASIIRSIALKGAMNLRVIANIAEVASRIGVVVSLIYDAVQVEQNTCN